jgi:ACS family hexuronate transporter-like MFS transporter
MMSSPVADPNPFVRSQTWRWWVCGLLLLATMINYMDRLVLNQTASRLMVDVGFDEAGYGQLEGYFGAAFAAGALSLGFVVDRFGPRIIYPTVVLLWSLAGFVTGFVRTFEELLVCRIALGFFEAANWSCALKTTQAILRPDERTMGNGILQSGAAVGAVLTPLLVLAFLHWDVYNGWRPAFWSVGGLGLFWVVLWLVVVRSGDLDQQPEGVQPAPQPTSGKATTGAVVWTIVSDRRFWVLAFTVVAINLTWHFFRAWMPLFLEKKHDYSLTQIQWFTMAYYLATDVGSLLAGFLALRLARRGLAVHTSRLLVFGSCAALTLLSIPVAYLPAGPLLLGLLLVLGFAALGLFPNYYSFSQELTTQHQGKVSGMLGCACWLAMYPMQINVGAYVKATQSYTEAVALAGLPPLAALLVLLLFWKSAPQALPAAQPAPLPDGVPTAALGAYTVKPEVRA